jgi:hypothetical protein
MLGGSLWALAASVCGMAVRASEEACRTGAAETPTPQAKDALPESVPCYLTGGGVNQLLPCLQWLIPHSFLGQVDRAEVPLEGAGSRPRWRWEPHLVLQGIWYIAACARE